MSEVQLVVRAEGGDWSGPVHGSIADLAIAALSADPVTLHELERAAARFAKLAPDRARFRNLSPGIRDEPYDAGLVVIDLLGRLVVVDSTYSSPSSSGYVDYHDGHQATDVPLRYHVADDWLFLRDSIQWRFYSDKRRSERLDTVLLDFRAVLYGPPLLEFVAREVFSAWQSVRAGDCQSANGRATEGQSSDEPRPSDDVSCRDDAADENVPIRDLESTDDPFAETARTIHVAWLMTPRPDLQGATPREVALARHDQLTWDLQDRCEQWSRLLECPPGLDESSRAYRFGAFGTHEWVMYYELVRELIWSSRDRLSELQSALSADMARQAFTVGDFLTDEVPRLAEVREAWLDTPREDFDERTARSIIHRERARLPEGISGHEAMVDPECPCCQAMAELPGPGFWHLDGSEMDDDFAFDLYCETREEWEAQRRQWEEDSRRFNAEWLERERLSQPDIAADDDIDTSPF